MPKNQPQKITPKLQANQINLSSIDAGSISVLKIDMETGEQWGETIYADGRRVVSKRTAPRSRK